MGLIIAAGKAGILDRATEIIKDMADQGTQQMRSEIGRLRAELRHRGDKVRRIRMSRQPWRAQPYRDIP